MSSRRSVTEYWDAHITVWLEGRDALPEPLDRWFASYAGAGAGAVTRDGFVEPYQGDLIGAEAEPRAVVLGLNPGRYLPDLQSLTGTFAEEIRPLGSYSGWVRTHPYDRDPWLARHGPNRYYRARLAFVRRWLGDLTAHHNTMLIFELYPWHSTAVTGPMRPPPDTITEFVWKPISELAVRHVFAFGAPWAQLAGGSLRLQQVAVLGRAVEASARWSQVAPSPSSNCRPGSYSSPSRTPEALALPEPMSWNASETPWRTSTEPAVRQAALRRLTHSGPLWATRSADPTTHSPLPQGEGLPRTLLLNGALV